MHFQQTNRRVSQMQAPLAACREPAGSYNILLESRFLVKQNGSIIIQSVLPQPKLQNEKKKSINPKQHLELIMKAIDLIQMMLHPWLSPVGFSVVLADGAARNLTVKGFLWSGQHRQHWALTATESTPSTPAHLNIKMPSYKFSEFRYEIRWAKEYLISIIKNSFSGNMASVYRWVSARKM